MIERAQSQRQERCQDVGGDVDGVERLAGGQQALYRFGSEPEPKGDDDEGEVEDPAPGGVEDPVEGDGQGEEGEEVQDLWVDLGDLGGAET